MNALKLCEGKRVLLIDDDVGVRQSIGTILKEFGVEVTLARDGTEGLKLFSCGGFDTVITDYSMPGMVGSAVAEAIKTNHPAQRVIMLSGYPDKAMAEGKVPWFLDEILEKPPRSIVELLNAI